MPAIIDEYDRFVHLVATRTTLQDIIESPVSGDRCPRYEAWLQFRRTQQAGDMHALLQMISARDANRRLALRKRLELFYRFAPMPDPHSRSERHKPTWEVWRDRFLPGEPEDLPEVLPDPELEERLTAFERVYYVGVGVLMLVAVVVQIALHYGWYP
ncbi:MAG: hypothetical protein A2W00_04605 [Candidatus Eisenbacteria bacterium RBG_16_71_46]|nr:MAG: hypothetical protein A2W00_04605 [Candidatus Eisenbacteria bacterium RBG_16_71_46]